MIKMKYISQTKFPRELKNIFEPFIRQENLLTIEKNHLNSLIREKVTLQAQSLLRRLDSLANEDSNFGSMFFRILINGRKMHSKFSRNHYRKKVT